MSTQEITLNFEPVFRMNQSDNDLQSLTNIICMKMMRHSSVLKTVAENNTLEEYKIHLSSLMRVYNTIDFYILWDDTVKFLNNNGINVKY